MSKTERCKCLICSPPCPIWDYLIGIGQQCDLCRSGDHLSKDNKRRKGGSSMAKRTRSSDSGSSERKTSLPGDMKFKREKGGDLDSLGKKFKSSNQGDMLRIGKDEEYVVAIMSIPEEWDTGYEHAITTQDAQRSWVYLPCTDNCQACAKMPENEARLYAFIPLYIYESGKVQFFRAPSTIWNELVAKYKRNKSRFLTNQYILVRQDGDGAVKYEVDRQDEVVSPKIKKAKTPDFESAMADRWHRAIDALGWKVTGEKFASSGDNEEDNEEDPFDHSEDDDIDLDDVKEMNKEQLLEVIDEYDLEIPRAKKKTLKALKQLVLAKLKELDESDEEEEDDEEEEED